MTTAVELLRQVKDTGYERGKPVYSRIAQLIRQGSDAFTHSARAVSSIDSAVTLAANCPDLTSRQVGEFLNITYSSFAVFLSYVGGLSSLSHDREDVVANQIMVTPDLDHKVRYEALTDIGEQQRKLAIERTQILAEKELLALYFKAALAEIDMTSVIEHLSF